MTTFDPVQVRADFPILSREVDGKPLVYLDNGATSQKPNAVIDKTAEFYRSENANIHRGVHYLSRKATDLYEQARESIGQALNLPDTHELIFVRGTTEGINLITHSLKGRFEEGDEIVLTLMEHHANFVPWQVLAQHDRLKVEYVAPTSTGEIDLDDWKSRLGSKTRVAAFTHISNVLGTINPVEEMVAYARSKGILTVVDGAQAVPHGPVDLLSIGSDFYVFSGHKMFGPDGIGIVAGPTELLNEFPPYQTGGDMIERVSVEGTTFRHGPERFEAGTPNISGVVGLAETFRYLESIDWVGAHQHEEHLRQLLTSELEKMGGVRIYGSAPEKTAIVSFLMESAHSHDVATILDTEGVAIRAGHHCAQPLMDHLGVSATARASIAIYNNETDIEALLRAVHKVKQFFE